MEELNQELIKAAFNYAEFPKYPIPVLNIYKLERVNLPKYSGGEPLSDLEVKRIVKECFK